MTPAARLSAAIELIETIDAQRVPAAKALKEDPVFKSVLAAANKHFASLKADLFHPCELGWRGPGGGLRPG